MEQILSVVATHSQYDKTVNTRQYSNRLPCIAPSHLKLLMDTYLPRGSESCYHTTTKAKIRSHVLAPKIASEVISQH